MSKKNARPRVLLVDDYPDAREMYSEYLQFSGFDVVEAANGMEALQSAIDRSPDIILMDLSLPVMDGWEATQRIRSLEKGQRIPIIALTAQAMAGDEQKALAAGCDDYVAKPIVDPNVVREKMERLLGPVK